MCVLSGGSDRAGSSAGGKDGAPGCVELAVAAAVGQHRHYWRSKRRATAAEHRGRRLVADCRTDLRARCSQRKDSHLSVLASAILYGQESSGGVENDSQCSQRIFVTLNAGALGYAPSAGEIFIFRSLLPSLLDRLCPSDRV